MIEYKFPEEKEFILHYAKALNQPKIEQIINNGVVLSAADAKALTKFMWLMADQAATDKREALTVAEKSDLEAWTEYVFQTVRSYLRGNGYEKEWEDNS